MSIAPERFAPLLAPLTVRPADGSRLCEQVLAREQMAVLGRLTDGLLHEVNNAMCAFTLGLAAMEGIAADLGACDGGPQGETKDDLRRMLRDWQATVDGLSTVLAATRGAANRATYLTAFDPAGIVRGAAALFGAARRTCQLEVDVPLSLPQIQGRPGDLSDVVLHLLENGYEAAAVSPALSIQAFETSGHVRIVVRDNGRGIPPDRIDQVFDPEFSTKPPGTGGGLGLWFCRAIVVDRMNGSIRLSPAAHRGTCAIIDVPVSSALP
ncbi:MAG: HAMP domain-containing sensor histidine kinase [Pseudomonadota bacterium]